MRRLVLGLVAGLVGLPAVGNASRPGEIVATPEGWYRVEPEGTLDEGQLTVVVVDPPPPVPSTEAPSPAEETSPHPADRPVQAPRAFEADPCRPLRARYVEILFRMAGIWDAPWALDFLEAWGGSAPILSPWVRFSLFGLPAAGPLLAFPPGVAPFRPLAWDTDLRRAARELAACSSGTGTRATLSAP
jgi:hypothetical protein